MTPNLLDSDTIRSMFDIGSNLKEARSRRSIELGEAEEDTKIRSKYLAALESEDFEVLPGAVFVRGFLRTYARYLGLDPQLYIDEYNARFGRFEEVDDQAALHPFPIHGDQRSTAARRTMRVVAIVSLVAIAVVIWVGLRDPQQNAADSTATSSRTTSQNDSSAGPVTETTQDAVADAQASRTELQQQRARAKAASKPVAAKVAVLTIRTTTGASWVEVRRGSAAGEVLYSATMQAGASKVVKASRLYVTIGMPSVTQLVGGRQTIDGSGKSTRNYLVTPTAIRDVT